MLKVAIAGLVLINLITYFVFWLDKARAKKGGRRISERELLVWAAVGGSPAAFFAMRRFRHKTRKRSFRFGYWGVVLLQIAVVAYLLHAQR